VTSAAAAGPRADYLLLLGANMALRERAIIGAVRVFPGPIAMISPGPRTRSGKFFDYLLPGVASDPDAALAAVRDFEARTGARPAGVVPFVDGLLTAGLVIAEHYGLPYLSRTAVQTSSINKNLMKDRLLAAGIATPRYRQVADPAELLAAIDELGLPCVIKPSAFGGSLGVRLVTDRDQATEAYGYVRAIIDQAAATFTVKNRSIQVEEFCALPDEVSVEVLNQQGRQTVLAVVDKSLGPRPFFAEIGHRTPSRYTDRSDLRALAMAACRTLYLDRGLAHVEFRLAEDGAPQLMEVGCRTAGGGIPDLVEAVTGLSLYELQVRCYLNQLDDALFDQPPTSTGLAAIAVLKAPAGRIVRIGTPSTIDPAVASYEVLAGVGDESAAVSANYLHREGYVECFWPAAGPADVPAAEHLRIAEQLAGELFQMAD
jgi:hypothetical protein